MGIFSLIFICAKIAFDVKDFKDNGLYKGKEIKISFGNVVVAIWLICYISLSMIFTTGLLIFHINVVKFDKTTREDLKKLFLNPFSNPYQRSTKENFKNILIPNIKRTSVLDELKRNKNKYIKYINSKQEKKEKDVDTTDITDISIEIDNGSSKTRKTKANKNKNEFKEKKEDDGFLLLYKRLEDGKFSWPRNEQEVRNITREQFIWLTQGLSIDQPKAIKKVVGGVDIC